MSPSKAKSVATATPKKIKTLPSQSFDAGALAAAKQVVAKAAPAKKTAPKKAPAKKSVAKQNPVADAPVSKRAPSKRAGDGQQTVASKSTKATAAASKAAVSKSVTSKAAASKSAASKTVASKTAVSKAPAKRAKPIKSATGKRPALAPALKRSGLPRRGKLEKGEPADLLRASVISKLEDMKARDLIVIDVRGKTSVTDYLLVVSGTSTRHVKAMADEVVITAKAAKLPPLGVEGEREAEWVLVDLGDMVVHLMLPRAREFYQLEKMWGVEAPRGGHSG